MDEFGVLTERYGLKPQGKSAPMSQAKQSTASATVSTNQNFGFGTGSSHSSMAFSSKPSWDSGPNNGSLLDDHGSFGFGDNYGYGVGGFGRTPQKQQNTSNNSSNGSSFDLDSMLFNLAPKSSSTDSFDDIFGGMPGSQKASNDYDYESFTSSTKQNGSVGNLLGDFSGVAAKLKSSTTNGVTNGLSDSRTDEVYSDDLIPGFGGSSHSNNRTKVSTTKSANISTEDPFVILESASSSVYNFLETSTDPLEEFSMFSQSGGAKARGSSDASSSSRPPRKPSEFSKADKVKSSDASPIDEDFAMGRMHNKSSRSKEAEDANKRTQQKGEDMESFFGASSRSTSAPKSRATSSVPVFDANLNNGQQNTFAVVSSKAKKTSAAAMAFGVDDLSSVFGATPMFGEFEEVEGESDERRTARFGRQQRTQDRVARAVADMNQRDRLAQYEQEERRRIAEAIDFEIKRWAAGKEGNMRALLSSLQQVLWSECGWEPVSLTDLITSGSVKKVYRKATLFVHPDKVQQKGATLEQKYIAEKVFDILKEAWTKFNKEELS